MHGYGDAFPNAPTSRSSHVPNAAASLVTEIPADLHFVFAPVVPAVCEPPSTRTHTPVLFSFTFIVHSPVKSTVAALLESVCSDCISVITHIPFPESFGTGRLVSGQVGDAVLLACNGFAIAEVCRALTQRRARLPSDIKLANACLCAKV